MVSNKICKNCYYASMCPAAKVCEYFTPVTSEAEDAVIEELVEQEREEYHKAWIEYISEY